MAKARDTARISHVKQIQWALESYFDDTGKYPYAGSTIGSEPNWWWTNSAHSWSWNKTQSQLEFYIKKLPIDPVNTGISTLGWGWGINSYAYFSIPTYCGWAPAYAFVYSLETEMKAIDTMINSEYCPDFANYRSGQKRITIWKAVR